MNVACNYEAPMQVLTTEKIAIRLGICMCINMVLFH